ncbi:MAG: NADH-quinone oxidoreductase subunit NuoE family protein [Candidatus Aminicenantia bacterium]
MEVDYNSIVDGIIRKYEGKKEAIISILQDIQAELRWLPESILELVSKKLNFPLNRIYGIATFYKSFSLKPKGKHTITVCMGTACHVRGGGKIVDTLSEKLKIKPGETTSDEKFTLETVNCVGCCAIGPIVILDGEYYGNMTSSMAPNLVENIEKENGNVSVKKSQ